MKHFFYFFLLGIVFACTGQEGATSSEEQTEAEIVEAEDTVIEKPLFCNAEVEVGAARFDQYLNLLEGKKVGVVGNQSSQVGDVHLVDTLLAQGVNVIRVFSPEHGFRGKADAGEKIDNEMDQRTGLPIISLYGKNKKPTSDQLSDLDVLLFDIQDVGVRFYTYISTLHYVLEAAAENDVAVIVLDRPNPNGHYVDGPVLTDGYDSFVGMHQVPVVHGMTVGEYAQMINGEEWTSAQADLTVVSCTGWDHSLFYELPIAPSPNLPNMNAIYLYPQLCFFEGTEVSIGRGTDFPFQVMGHPEYTTTDSTSLFSFIPQPNEGAKHPKLEGEECHGMDFRVEDLRELQAINSLDLSLLYEVYANLDMGDDFFLSNHFIDLLAGTNELRKDILSGGDFEAYRATWEPELNAFKEIRAKYLLYAE